MTPGLVLCLFIAFAIATWPEETSAVVERCILEMRIMELNFKMERLQRKMYRQLVKDAKTMGWPAPPPFKFVPIQQRGKF